jgi:hypothetical protein
MNKIDNKYFVKQKIAVTTLCMLFVLLFALSACEKQQDENNKDECELPSTMIGYMYNCLPLSFLEGSSAASGCSNTYIIKGIALEEHEYGRNIQLVEDLKGNFPKDVNTFTAWGGNRIISRTDNLKIYNEQDVLIMHLMPTGPYEFEHREGETWIEESGDYCTFPCLSSVVKLSDGYVTGYIFPIKENGSWGRDTLKWEDFQKEIDKTLVVK